MNGGGVSTQIGLGCNGLRESVNALIGQFAGSEVDYPLYGPAFALAAKGAEPDVFIV